MPTHHPFLRRLRMNKQLKNLIEVSLPSPPSITEFLGVVLSLLPKELKAEECIDGKDKGKRKDDDLFREAFEDEIPGALINTRKGQLVALKAVAHLRKVCQVHGQTYNTLDD